MSLQGSNDEKFQELCRILDATLGKINPDGLVNGTNAVKIINFLTGINGMDKFISHELNATIAIQMMLAKSKSESDEKANFREHVKKIYMFPKTGYGPMTNLNLGAVTYPDIFNELQSTVSKIKFSLELLDGKVYAVPTQSGIDMINSDLIPYVVPQPELKDIIFDSLIGLLLREGSETKTNVCKNMEKSHITVVNSNIVYDCVNDKVKDFLEGYKDLFSVKIGDVSTTVSEDWAPFSRCYVIGIQSDYIDKFVDDFNKQFNKQIKVSKHMTFAIVPRSMLP